MPRRKDLMNVKHRILALQLLEKQEKNPTLFEELGIEIKVISKEENINTNSKQIQNHQKNC